MTQVETKALAAYHKACNKLVALFSKKHDIEFDYWVCDEVGGIASFITQYFFTMDDIVFDIATEQPKGLILQWQDDTVKFYKSEDNQINFKSYTKGLRHNQVNNSKP